jgi:hypothetical protein
VQIERIATWSEDLKLPILVLTTNSPYGSFRDPTAWRLIEHQAGGHACMQFQKDCMILPIKDSAYRGIRELTDKWLDSCVGMMGGPALSTANEYSADLAKLGLTCEFSYRSMMEAVYPFDTTVESLRLLTDHSLPADLDDLLVFKSDLEKIFGIVGRWQAYILGQNCD